MFKLQDTILDFLPCRGGYWLTIISILFLDDNVESRQLGTG